MTTMAPPGSDRILPWWRDLPRWQGALALIIVGVIYLWLPAELRVGPNWLLLAAVVALLIPLFTLHINRRSRLSHAVGQLLTGLVAAAVASSVVFLAVRLPGGKIAGSDLLRDSILTWVANILAFALLYWELDAGGPGRRRRGSYQSNDFVFPQFQQDPAAAARSWAPDLIDYLFLAFNTSTAFSPTDTLVLSRRIKLVMMAQALISLIVISVLASRASNIL
ncbi:MAG: hypothetical protein ACYDCQ_04455 [Dehalococcoidia bacterium]